MILGKSSYLPASLILMAFKSEKSASKSMSQKLQCEICSVQFSHILLWRKHQKIHKTRNKTQKHKGKEKTHRVDKNLKCNICEKDFDCPANKEIHDRTHSGEKPYKCEICGLSYKVRKELSLFNAKLAGNISYQRKT